MNHAIAATKKAITAKVTAIFLIFILIFFHEVFIAKFFANIKKKN